MATRLNSVEQVSRATATDAERETKTVILGNRLNLYSAGSTEPSTKPVSKVPPKPVNWISRGCITDNVGGRTLPYGAEVAGGSRNMTNNNCVAACKEAGYTIAGTEYSGEVGIVLMSFRAQANILPVLLRQQPSRCATCD